MFENQNDEALKAAQAEAAQAKAEAEARKTELESIRAEKDKSDAELAKLRNKDMNFKRLREMTDEEKDKLTEQEMSLKRKEEELDDRLSSHEKAVRNDWRSAAIEKASHGDPDKAKAIEEALKDVTGEDTDRSAIESRVAKAARLARKDNEVDHVGSAMSFSGSAPERQKEKDFADTPEGSDFARRSGFRFAQGNK
jgi:chromosome segregation ATPase